jgi:hypothetical protein
MAEPVEEMPGRRQFRVERGWLQVRQAVHPAVHAPVKGFNALCHFRNAECVNVIWRGLTGQGGVQQGSDGSEVGLPGVLGFPLRAQLLEVALKPREASKVLKTWWQIDVLSLVQATLTGSKRPSLS